MWSSCAPEFGVRAVVDRLAQVEPRVLLTVDGYRYGDRDIDRAAEVAAIRAALPGLEAVVVVPYLRDEAGATAAVPGAIAWRALLGDPGTAAPLAFERVPFDHPLYILFSSGTTGLPKAIVHGTAASSSSTCKALALHTDLGPDDRFCWFTTTGWMMWNYLVSGLRGRLDPRPVRRQPGLARPPHAVAARRPTSASRTSASPRRSSWPAGRPGSRRATTRRSTSGRCAASGRPGRRSRRPASTGWPTP